MHACLHNFSAPQDQRRRRRAAQGSRSFSCEGQYSRYIAICFSSTRTTAIYEGWARAAHFTILPEGVALCSARRDNRNCRGGAAACLDALRANEKAGDGRFPRTGNKSNPHAIRGAPKDQCGPSLGAFASHWIAPDDGSGAETLHGTWHSAECGRRRVMSGRAVIGFRTGLDLYWIRTGSVLNIV